MSTEMALTFFASVAKREKINKLASQLLVTLRAHKKCSIERENYNVVHFELLPYRGRHPAAPCCDQYSRDMIGRRDTEQPCIALHETDPSWRSPRFLFSSFQAEHRLSPNKEPTKRYNDNNDGSNLWLATRIRLLFLPQKTSIVAWWIERSLFRMTYLTLAKLS